MIKPNLKNFTTHKTIQDVIDPEMANKKKSTFVNSIETCGVFANQVFLFFFQSQIYILKFDYEYSASYSKVEVEVDTSAQYLILKAVTWQ